jgi:hypothetical protein
MLIRQTILWRILGRRLVAHLIADGWLAPIARPNRRIVLYDERDVRNAIARLRTGYPLSDGRARNGGSHVSHATQVALEELELDESAL